MVFKQGMEIPQQILQTIDKASIPFPFEILSLRRFLKKQIS